MTLAVACTVADYREYFDYWTGLAQKLDARIQLLILVQTGSANGPALRVSPPSNMKVFFREQLGLSRARNDCIKLSRTRWLWFMDADSLLSEAFLSPEIVEEFLDTLRDTHAIVFHESSRGNSWRSASRMALSGPSLKRLTSLRSPNLVIDVDFVRRHSIRFSPMLGKNSRFGWPRHGEEFAFAMGMAMQGARIQRIDFSPVTALRPSTGNTIGPVEKYAALLIIACVIVADWMRSRFFS
ncbi:MAG: glycosyltransferase [Nitratireductor sp.]|nr:glycosyltransferase [Nitratireductor sp.]